MCNAKYTLRTEQHNEACNNYAAQNRSQRFGFRHFEQRCDQCTRPCSGARQRDRHKKEQTQPFIPGDLTGLSEQLLTVLGGKSGKRAERAHPVQQLFAEKQ